MKKSIRQLNTPAYIAGLISPPQSKAEKLRREQEDWEVKVSLYVVRVD